jgi:hypothetical protein
MTVLISSSKIHKLAAEEKKEAFLNEKRNLIAQAKKIKNKISENPKTAVVVVKE